MFGGKEIINKLEPQCMDLCTGDCGPGTLRSLHPLTIGDTSGDVGEMVLA